MSTRQWVNSRQPQTLYLAQILMYIQGGMDLLFTLPGGLADGRLYGLRILAIAYLLLTVVGKLVAAFGIANSMRWAYRLGVAAAAAPVALRAVAVFGGGLGRLWVQPISLLFDIALLALLLHRQSRSHQKHWFR